MPTTGYNATLIRRIDITSRLAIFQVRPDGDTFPFTPGQFTTLGLRRDAPRAPEAEPDEVPPEKAERLVRRAYSISSGSHQREYIEFYISLVASGELTPRLFALNEGDRLFMGEKATGLFTLDRVPAGKRILMVATGTGLAPYMSMVRSHALSCPNDPMGVLQGASYSWDLGYRGELESLNRQCHNFHYLPVVSRPAEDRDWQGRSGRLTEWLAQPQRLAEGGFPLDPADTHVFLCGHPAMVEEATTLLTAQGFDPGSRKEPGNLHVEKYW